MWINKIYKKLNYVYEFPKFFPIGENSYWDKDERKINASISGDGSYNWYGIANHQKHGN